MPSSPETLTIGPAEICWTDARHGDVAQTSPDAVFPKQVHGSRALVVEALHTSTEEADAVVTTVPGLAIGIRTADCVPIALVGNGVVAAVHAGWKGLLAGVVPSTARVMRELGATEITAAVGPCIHVECYAFGNDELHGLTEHWNATVRGITSDGRPALDMLAAVSIELERNDIVIEYVSSHCTGHSGRHFSHRILKSPQRQAMLVKMAR